MAVTQTSAFLKMTPAQVFTLLPKHTAEIHSTVLCILQPYFSSVRMSLHLLKTLEKTLDGSMVDGSTPIIIIWGSPADNTPIHQYYEAGKMPTTIEAWDRKQLTKSCFLRQKWTVTHWGAFKTVLIIFIRTCCPYARRRVSLAFYPICTSTPRKHLLTSSGLLTDYPFLPRWIWTITIYEAPQD